MNKQPVVVIGDIMLDQYYFGESTRKNPESPAPLMEIRSEEKRLWGAANVAANLSWMGVSTNLIGTLWNDLRWEAIQELCKKNNVLLHALLTEQRTTLKKRFIETTYNQQLLRADDEERSVLSELQRKSVIEQIYALDPEYIVIADYNKWMLDDELITQLNDLSVKIFLDTKSFKIKQFKNIYLLKPNFGEFQEIIGKKIKNTDLEIESHGKHLAESLNCNVVITRGREWASLITPNWEYMHLITEEAKAFDVCGAGDTFSAGLVTWLKHGMSLADAVKLGNKASGIAVRKIWTSVITKEELFGL